MNQNQQVTQAIVISQERLIPGKGIARLSLFNLDGTPYTGGMSTANVYERFDTTDDFPVEGSEDILYIDNSTKDVWIWDGEEAYILQTDAPIVVDGIVQNVDSGVGDFDQFTAIGQTILRSSIVGLTVAVEGRLDEGGGLWVVTSKPSEDPVPLTPVTEPELKPGDEIVSILSHGEARVGGIGVDNLTVIRNLTIDDLVTINETLLDFETRLASVEAEVFP